MAILFRNKIMIVPYFFVYLLNTNAAFPASGNCPSPQKISKVQLNHIPALQAYFKTVGTKVRSIEDFICCLPEEFQKRVLISATSIAGQNGTPESPRVFMLGAADPSGPKSEEKDINDNFDVVFTANGGGPHSQQGNNIEVAQFNSKNNEVEYFDIDFSTGFPKVSEKNPISCMGCHGEDGERPRFGGAKPIFEPFGNWARIVGGTAVCSKEEDQLQQFAQKTAIQSVLKNRRFRCLGQEQLKEDYESFALNSDGITLGLSSSSDVIALDLKVFEYNTNRVIKLIRKTPDFESYKYALYGLEVCGDGPSFDLAQWIPEEVLKRHNDTSSLQPELKGKLDRKSVQKLWQRLRTEAEKHKSRLTLNLQDLNKVKRQGFDIANNHMQCPNNPDTSHLAEQSMVDQMLNVFSGKSETLNKYQLDTLAHFSPGNVRGAIRGGERFLFEGRGISMASFAADAKIGTYRMGFDLEEILSSEPKDSVLRKIIEENPQPSLNFGPGGVTNEKERQEAKEKLCSSLKAQSLKSLSEMELRKKRNSDSPKPIGIK